MRFVSTQTMNAWRSTWKGGSTKAVTRATIEEFLMETTPYDSSTIARTATVAPRPVTGVFASGVFNPGRTPRELPNIKEVSWTRTVDSDAATLSMTLWNTEPLPIGQPPVEGYAFDIPGYYSAGRGSSGEPSEWGNVQNEWRGLIAPDRVIRVFEGYGFDPLLAPEKDPHLYPAGVFLVDTVQYTNDGLIVIQARDLIRMMMEQLAMPPVVPQDEYPLSFTKIGSGTTAATSNTTNTAGFVIGSSAWTRPTYSNDSNDFWVGKSITDDLGRPMVDNHGGVSGHYGAQAFDADPNTYWLSVGAAYSDVPRFIEGTVPLSSVYAVSVKPWGGAVTCYVSVQVNGVWQGTTTVPYRNGSDQLVTGATIPYVVKQNVNSGVYTTINLPRNSTNGPLYSQVTRVRFTFTGLHQYGTGKYNWRVGLWDAFVSDAPNTTTAAPATSTDVPSIPPFEYGDYSTIIRYLCAWGGFYWPADSTGRNVLNYSDGTNDVISGGSAGDPDLPPTGWIWGDIINTGTAGVTDLPVSEFDKKPLLDCLSGVRDIVQYNFFVDECGGAVWRTPNIWEIGNYVSPIRPTEGRRNGGRTVDILDIKDDETILGMSVELNSRNVRETVFVGNTTGSLGATAKLITNNQVGPFQTNMRRASGWCVDTETEILTRRGWLRYDEVKPGDETLSIDETSGCSVWQPISDVKIFPDMVREMCSFKTNNFSAVTTPDHRWLVKRLSSETGRYDWKWRTSATLGNMDRFMRALPCSSLPTTVEIPDHTVELVAWLYTEGWRHDGRLEVCQSLRVNPDNCRRIGDVLEAQYGPMADGALAAGVRSWREYPARNEMMTWGISAEASTEILPYFESDSMAPTMDFVSKLTQEQLELFIDIARLGDGHDRRTATNSRRVSRFFYQQVGPRLDIFLAICALAGVPTSYHVVNPDDYENNFTKKPKATVTLLTSPMVAAARKPYWSSEKILHDGIVWCPTMPEHHTWLARRNGSIYFTGNTDVHFESAPECLVMAELIMLRQLFTYRTNKITIPANPAIQVDDQIRVWDRVAAETFLHYIAGVTSKMDMSQGTWTYELSTHWLGTDPFTNWAFRPGDLSNETKIQSGVVTPATPPPNSQTADYGWFYTGTSSTHTVKAIAQQYGISEEAIRTVNGSALNGVTTVASHSWVRVRSTEGPITTAAEGTYSSYGWLQANSTWTVDAISAAYGITVSTIRSWNGWLTGSSVSGGKWVKIRSNAVLLQTTAS